MVEGQPQDKDWFSRPGDSVLSAMRRRSVSAEALSSELAGGSNQLRFLMQFAGFQLKRLMRGWTGFPLLVGDKGSQPRHEPSNLNGA